MSLIDQNSILPGVITEIESDYSSDYDTSLFGTTDSVVIIGTAFNGPVSTPIKVYSPEHAKYIFGSVYDSTTKQEASLVKNILDCWDRGCRTIYAIRVSGQEIYKDYQLAADTDLKLRVSGFYPSNRYKDAYFTFDNSTFDMNVTFYKPAERATIAEKNQGLVESTNSILVNTIDLYSSGFSKEDNLVDLIDKVNSYSYNNVIKLSIVDTNGNDVTLSSIEAKSLKIGDMFPGLYTIGRNKNVKNIVKTQMNISFEQPYAGFSGEYCKVLTLNTDITKDLPIYSANNDINVVLNISCIKEYDFLKTVGSIDEVFGKDDTDYEEVTLSNFELYNKLGSGFAINAEIKEIAPGKFKVKEVTDKDRKKTEIKNGIYSTLENLPVRYRVLAGANADDSINGSLPKLRAFKFAKANSVKMLNDSVELTANIDREDFSAPKKYSVEFKFLEQPEDIAKFTIDKKDIDTASIIKYVNLLPFADYKTITKDDIKDGEFYLVTDYEDAAVFGKDGDAPDATAKKVNVLFVGEDNKLVMLNKFVSATETDYLKDSLVVCGTDLYKCNSEIVSAVNPELKANTFAKVTTNEIGKKYAFVSMNNETFNIVSISDDGSIETLGTADDIFNTSEDENGDIFIVTIDPAKDKTKVTIQSNQLDYLTISEVVEKLQQNKGFNKLFNIEVIDILKAQAFFTDLEAAQQKATELTDKTITYDTTKLIAFRTEDNFARQLAQHCTYTSLKTYPTHGFIGTSILLDTSINAIANKVNGLIALNLSNKMVAKKGNGTNMLDRNNLPYPIGSKVSVTVGQYNMTTDDGYTFISNMAAGYAGMVSCLPLDQSSTCQTITIPTPGYSFNNYQLQSLTNAGFVTVKDSYTKGWVVTDGITMGPVGSPSKRLSASRISDAVSEAIRTVCEPYIGKQNNLTNQNSINTALKAELTKLTGTLIESFDFTLRIDNSTTQLGTIYIDFRIIPIYEISEIFGNVKITK